MIHQALHPEVARSATIILHYAYPLVLFLIFTTLQCIAVCTFATLRTSAGSHPWYLFIWLQLAVIASYAGEASLMIARSLLRTNWWSSQDHIAYVLSSMMVWGVISISMFESQAPVWSPFCISWLLSLCFEAAIFGLSVGSADAVEPLETGRLVVQGFRIFILVVMPMALWYVRRTRQSPHAEDEETSRLLGGPTTTGNYGATPLSDTDSENSLESEAAKTKLREKLEKSGNWWKYLKSFNVLWKYMWPRNDVWLQISMVLVGGCLLLERVLKVMVPLQLGAITNALGRGNGAVPWVEVFLYVLYRWLDSQAGISALKDYLWVPIEQYSYRSITTAAYNHVMSLSYDFHCDKNTGELWMSICLGRSVNGIIDMLLFQILPMLSDLCIAFAYFYILFNAYMSMIVATVAIVFLWATAKLSAVRMKIRRDLNMASRNETRIMVETVSSWTTVSYFNNIPYEQDRYHTAIRKYQQAERSWHIGMSLVSIGQTLIFTVGLLAASFLAVYQVTIGEKPVGSFVTLLTYWAQLAAPLNFFAGLYRRVQNQMLDAERLLELLETKASVSDKFNATVLGKVDGEIEFKNVGFSYDPRKPAIRDISFRAAPGSTIALVGETGGGKTTCLKLLFRFYDVDSGSITVDGHDIRDVTLDSLRSNMGVVPQDPQLFNDTILNNIKYARFDATDEDVYTACRAASIHEKILSFPDGYNSKVGERGIRLSGGELQRVAIARAILRDPKIILLDEATSMVDMDTERHIQGALKELAKNRTMFVIAHRLSTIMNADLIVVIKDGEICESGTHEELLDAGGKYFNLWSRQTRDRVVCVVQPPPDTQGDVDLLVADPPIQDAPPQSATVAGLDAASTDLSNIQSNNPVGHDQIAVPVSLPEAGCRRPRPIFNDPRLPAPLYGILKDHSASASMSRGGSVGSLPRDPKATLKPEAKEFVPRCGTPTTNAVSALTDSNDQTPLVAANPPLYWPSPGWSLGLSEGLDTKAAVTSDALQAPPDSSPAQALSSTASGPTPGTARNTESATCQSSTEEDATKNDRGHLRAKKKRRRSRQKHSSAETGESPAQAESSTGSEHPRRIALLPAVVEQNIGQGSSGDAPGAIDSLKKPRRRFRSTKAKCKPAGSENEDMGKTSKKVTDQSDNSAQTGSGELRRKTSRHGQSSPVEPTTAGLTAQQAARSEDQKELRKPGWTTRRNKPSADRNVHRSETGAAGAD